MICDDLRKFTGFLREFTFSFVELDLILYT